MGFMFTFQDNFSAVPKRVWADVVRKLGMNTNARNAAADLFVGSSSLTSPLLSSESADAFCFSICSSYIRLGCLNCD